MMHAPGAPDLEQDPIHQQLTRKPLTFDVEDSDVDSVLPRQQARLPGF